METFVKKQLELLSSGVPEKEARAIEKIYNLNVSNFEEKQLTWALLTKVVQSSSQAQFNAWRVRLTKKVAEISGEGASIAAGIFVRELLTRNPQAGELHEKTIEALIISLLDQSLTNEGATDIREIAIALYVARYGMSGISRLLNTLEVVLADKNLLEVDRTTLILLSQLGKATYKLQCVRLLFDLFVEVIKVAKPGETLPMKPLLQILSLSLKKEDYRDGAFLLISTLAEVYGSVLLPLISRIISALLTCLDHPTSELFKCLAKLTSTFGPSTGLQNHLYNIWSSLKQPLHEQIFNNDANLFLAEVIRNCGYLTKPEVLLHVSREICDSALRYPENKSSHIVVAALLVAQNELAPPPVHIARRLCALHPNSSTSLLQSLADNLARPRIQDIASVHLRTLTKNQGDIFKQSSMGINQQANLDQVHHHSTEDPPPDLDVNFTEDEMEENEENPTHFGNTEPLTIKNTSRDEKPIIEINLTEDEMEEVEPSSIAKPAKKTKKRMRNKGKNTTGVHEMDDDDIDGEALQNRKKIVKNGVNDSTITTIDIDLTEDEMEETESHFLDKKPLKKQAKKMRKKKIKGQTPVLNVALSEDEMEVAEELDKEAAPDLPSTNQSNRPFSGVSSAFVGRVQAKLKQKEQEKRRLAAIKSANVPNNSEIILGANEPTVEEIMSTFCPD